MGSSMTFSHSNTHMHNLLPYASHEAHTNSREIVSQRPCDKGAYAEWAIM